ncbi:DNA-directed RNA polymerase subunit alpha [Candidatus Dojkabacteria bacterium]|uniref:DNA-directed RNA polymerase subunit alpha n=1 Tax=Candidatus Dojkabacteria bacterium TaxID=2099670 RepID=A0A955IF13_9BACT|nr:DNA-directed RNA polymerase subunit alpha [Candidatus Dojkabacteria bacterium]
MISLREFTINKTEEKDNSAVFQIGPLPTGYGHTLGNILKRVLTSSIPGAAITAVKINGVQHEYSTLAGVSDDILSVLLSLKNVVFLTKTEEPVTLTLKSQGAKKGVVEVKAGDIEKSSDIEVINKDYVITKITDEKTKLDMEIRVERGVGYRLPDEHVRAEVGMLPVDAIFSPVKLVKLEIVPTRVGQQTDLDQLNLFVHTNGSLTPSDALNIASNILDEMASNFVKETKDMISGKVITSLPTESTEEETTEEEDTETAPILVADLNLSTRLTNALLRAGFDDLRKLEGFTEEEAANIRGMGEKSLEELFKVLKKNGINLI